LDRKSDINDLRSEGGGGWYQVFTGNVTKSGFSYGFNCGPFFTLFSIFSLPTHIKS
jgi:hypothetical protein